MTKPRFISGNIKIHMQICILCRLEKTEFNREHVIPAAVGGKIWIDSVCESCNSYLGAKIDKHLTNFFFVEMKRFDLKISGNSGKIPDPWVGVYRDPNSDEKKTIHISRNEAGQLERNFKPELEVLSNDPLRLKLTGKQEEIEKKLARYLKANNLSSSGLIMDRVRPSERQTARVPLEKEFYGNLFGYYRAFLKIAYEATATVIPEFLNSDSSKKMAEEILINDPLSEPKVNYFRPFENLAEMRKELIEICKVTEDDHFIVLIQDKQRLICLVFIFGLAHCIEMDTTQYLEPGIIVLFNDIKGDERKLQL